MEEEREAPVITLSLSQWLTRAKVIKLEIKGR
jgi:hypothetical protein